MLCTAPFHQPLRQTERNKQRTIYNTRPRMLRAANVSKIKQSTVLKIAAFYVEFRAREPARAGLQT